MEHTTERERSEDFTFLRTLTIELQEQINHLKKEFECLKKDFIHEVGLLKRMVVERD